MLKSLLFNNEVLTLFTLLGTDNNKNEGIIHSSFTMFFSHVPWWLEEEQHKNEMKHSSIIFSFMFLETSVLSSYNVAHTIGSTTVFDMA